MKLTFKSIKYKNIMSVGAKPIEIDLLNNRKILITGKNGGGKSTMLEALCFALFGKPFRNIKKNQLINTINKKGLLVELTFDDGKNDYSIKRGIKPNVFEIKRNGEEVVEAASVKDFQSMFETEIIKMNMQSFKQTIILGTAGYTPFMELSAGNRRTLIEDLINLSIYSQMDQLNKSVVKEIKQQMDSLEIRLTGLRNEYDAHTQHIEKQKTMSDTFISNLQVTYQSHANAAKSLNEDIQRVTQQLTDVILGDDVSASINKCRQAISLVSAKVDQIEQQKNFFSQHDNCPTCRQVISPDHKQSIVTQLNSQQSDLNSKSDVAKNSMVELEAQQKVFMETQQSIAALQNTINNTKQLLARELTSARNVKAQIESAQQSVDIDTSRVDELSSEISKSREDKTDLFEEMYARKIVLNMLKDSGIKAVVMKRYIPVINKKINQYLKMLGADYTFTLDQEFNEHIKSRGREDFSYTSFSQGEKARIDLSLLFTWRDVAALVSGTEISLLILDEVFDSATDGEGVQAIHTILESLNSNIVVISHREEHDKDKFNKHIRMIKKGRFSVME